ncbi:MAG: dihydrofolate reductase [Actinobacteria bacterium]|nr:MAG: dihydrofolate reductase [Actinomycetota bacterium]RIK08621.1 MAG: deaminase [Acidobacteriota bacterium]
MATSVYVGTSVDGFIARPAGEVDFLDSAEPLDEDYGFADFLASVDALVMGRNTFDWVIESGVEWPYGDKLVLVMTSRAFVAPPGLADLVEPTGLGPAEVLIDLAARGVERVYVDGGQTIQSFLRAGLVDELTITKVPVLIGTGIALFGELTGDVRLEHLETTSFDNGLVQSRYRVPRS